MAKKSAHETIYVYADWVGLARPSLMGLLHSTLRRKKKIFTFEYDEAWLKSRDAQIFDPHLSLLNSTQSVNDEKPIVGIFLDSSPGRWGRTLMDRRNTIIAQREKRPSKNLLETEYLLGVHDRYRMGAIRFKETPEGPFINNDTNLPTPPWSAIRELERASLNLEEHTGDDEETLPWIDMLIPPGSSLGGARPKASVSDDHEELWIAKFPSRHDSHDVGGWEKVAYDLAKNAGIHVPESVAGKFYSKRHTFLTKRFDRTPHGERLHFASAMTLLGHTDGTDYSGVGYLDLAEFIMQHGANPDADLEELWRRIVFYISVSNTDDHLRNHGFLLTNKGWTLSPAYDINPVPTGTALSLKISTTDNALSIDLALDVAEYFRISEEKATEIISVIQHEVSNWESVAEKAGIPKSERNAMANAFKY